MKTILQHDERDCGAACLAMVAGHYGYWEPLSVFREMTGTGQEGTSAYELIRAAESIGFSADALTGSADELSESLYKKEVKLPLIAHVNTLDSQSHFVVVSGFNDRNVSIYDPAKGKVIMTTAAFFRQWAGNIITLVPNASFIKKNKTSSGIFSFFSLLKGQMRSFAAIIIISVVISGIGIAGAFTFQLIIDHSAEIIVSEQRDEQGHHQHDIEYLSDSDFLNNLLERVSNHLEHLTADNVSSIFACLIVLYVIAAVIQYIRGLLIINMSKRIDIELSLQYFYRIIDLPIPSVQKRKTGDYLTRYSDLSAIRNAISTAAITMIVDSMMAVGCGIILYLQNRELFIIAGIIILLYTTLVMGNRKRIKDSNRKFMERNAYVQSYMKESIDGIETIKSLNAGSLVKSSMEEKFHEYIRAAVRKSRIVMTQEVLVTGIETIGVAVILWRGFSMVIQGYMTLGSLITFYALLGYLIIPVKNLIELQPVIQSGTVAAERLTDVLVMQTEEYEGADMSKLKEVDKWDVVSICFRYGIRDFILKNVSFSIGKGEKVAVVGESGSGKTTLAKNLAGFYHPESGSISADGVNIENYSIGSLRSTVSYISNNASLFSGSLVDNIQMGNPESTDEDIQKVCDIAKVKDLIDILPGGIHFLIEEGGANLSSGQRQRIAIARALLMNPKLLILDEATSNLDLRSEREILRAIETMYPDMVIVMISHRMSAMQGFDKIIVLREGKIVGCGKHNELLESCEYYSNLIMTASGEL